MRELLERVQVNCPFTMLRDRYAENFLTRGLNPEIGIDAAALDRFSPAEFGEVAARLSERGLTITLHGPFVDMSAGSIDPQIRSVTRRRFEQLLEVVPLFAPKTVVCHAGYDWKRYAYLFDKWLENSLAMWGWLAQRLNGHGCRLMLENVYEGGPEELLPLFEHLTSQGWVFAWTPGIRQPSVRPRWGHGSTPWGAIWARCTCTTTTGCGTITSLWVRARSTSHSFSGA
jgi:hypothetical protein